MCPFFTLALFRRFDWEVFWEALEPLASEVAPVAVGALIAVVATYWAQRAIVDYERARDGVATAWDELLKPLHDAVAAVPDPQPHDAAYAYSLRWSSLNPALTTLADKSAHRLAPLLVFELEQIRAWRDAEETRHQHWTAAMEAGGVSARALFAYLVVDPAVEPALFDEHAARVTLNVMGTTAAADWLVDQTVSLAKDEATWDAARRCAKEHRRITAEVDAQRVATVATLANSLRRGAPTRSGWRGAVAMRRWLRR